MNRTDIENDFKQRFGNGDIHTFFVPIPLVLMGGSCFMYGGSTLIAAMNAGIWVCGRINSSDVITVEETNGNIKVCLPVRGITARNTRPSYHLLFSLAHHFAADTGADILFHCDIPECACINTEIPRCIAAALICDKLFGTGISDITELVMTAVLPEYEQLVHAVASSRRNHAVYIDGGSRTVQSAPLLDSCQKIIAVYPKKNHLQKTPMFLKQQPPFPLNDIRLDSIQDKDSALYRLALSSQNAQSGFRALKNKGSDAFFTTFSEKCDMEGCFGKFSSYTDNYFTYDNSIDAVINEINIDSKTEVSFIVTGCAAISLFPHRSNQ